MSDQPHGGLVVSIEPGSLAAELGVQRGDVLLKVNRHAVEDVIDVQYYAADEEVTLRLRRGEKELALKGSRAYEQQLGLEFEHPTFDIDIRRCNNLCPFCFVLQMPARMRRALYIKDDDYRYSFLYGHFVTLTNLQPHDWARIETQHLSPLYVSVHATDLEVRRAALRNAQAPDILEQLRWLSERNIEVHTQLVITPGLNDGAHIVKSIRDLAQFWPHVRSVSVVPVGLTRHHRYKQRTLTLDEIRSIVGQVHGLQKEFKRKFSVRFAYLTDEWYLQLNQKIPSLAYYDGLDLKENGQGMVREFLDDWKKVQRELKSLRGTLANQSATLVTGTLFAPLLAAAASAFAQLSGSKNEVIGIVNERLGDSITVAGLLMGGDVIAQLQDRELGEVVVLPRIMFDHPDGIALDDVSPLEIARALERPVSLADGMGDVLDALTGRNRLTLRPSDDVIPLDVVRAGGWAVEKYL